MDHLGPHLPPLETPTYLAFSGTLKQHAARFDELDAPLWAALLAEKRIAGASAGFSPTNPIMTEGKTYVGLFWATAQRIPNKAHKKKHTRTRGTNNQEKKQKKNKKT